MVNKKSVIITTIIALIILGLMMHIGLHRADEPTNNVGSQDKQGNVNKIETNIKNDVSTENEENVENDTKENNEEENKIVENAITRKENNTKENTTSSGSKKEEKVNGEEKAISLAKKKWGENDDTVYYYVEEKISDNVYIISVRDSETTEDLGEYKVNIKTKKVEKN